MIEIPEITEPLGRYWDQPAKDEFVIDQLSEYAIMEMSVFKKFKEYSCSQPTGVYVGKMWVSIHNGVKYLRWFDYDPDPKYCSNKQLEIIII